MKKPSVTIQHKTGYVAAAVLFGVSLCVFFLNTVMPSEQHGQILGYVIAGAAAMLALFFLFWAQCEEGIDENGICIKWPFSVKQYSWNMVKRVSIAPPQGKDLPKIEIWMAGRRSPLLIDYTKRSLACLQFYYGEPDSDKWGRPPALT